MAANAKATSAQKLVIGGLAAVLGLFVVLASLGVIPGSRNPSGIPLWIVTGVGAMFFIIGAGVFVHAIVRPNDDGELSPDAPGWLRAVQYLAVTSVFGVFAGIAGWVAFGPGDRPCKGSIVVFGFPVTEMLGRAAFGFVAIVMGIFTLMLIAAMIGMIWQRATRGPDSGAY